MAGRDGQRVGRQMGTAMCGLIALLMAALAASARDVAETQDAKTASSGQAVAALHIEPPKAVGDGEDDSEQGESARKSIGLRKLTPEEINRVRFMELLGMRVQTDQPDRVKVKIPKETIDDFLTEMADDDRFRTEKQRRAFRKLTAAQKLHWIAYHKMTKYADQVEIKTDPEVFVAFKKHILPVVLRGCAKPGCHGATTEDDPMRFRLFNDPKKPPPTMYGNFLMLNEYEVDRRPLINREQPSESLLLTYMLPAKEVRPAFRHPGETDLKSVFRTRKTPRFRRVEKWIASLKHPAEDYGVRLFPKEPDAEDGSGEPSDKKAPEAEKLP